MTRRVIDVRAVAWVLLACLNLKTCHVSGLLLLSDLATPCLLLDLGCIRQQQRHEGAASVFTIPALSSSTNVPQVQLYPSLTEASWCSNYAVADIGSSSPPLSVATLATPGVCYLHTSVVRPAVKDAENPNFLVRLDLAVSSNNKRPSAHLVLGLNNHHVGSYYWARSAGMGSSMEAPGIQLSWSSAAATTSNCFLQWKSSRGFTDCNSNDGKRSEWVPFLRPGDTVQLIPSDSASCQAWLEQAVNLSWGIYGVSSQGRPLGSEPAVICQWHKVDESLSLS